ncbi:MAG: HTH-type transcriptional repressor FabR [Acidobacteriota bacterium]
MPTRDEQKQLTRRAIIDAALELSAENGFSSVSLRSVARKAGIAPNAFYRHFSDMEELGLSLVDEIGLSLRQLIRQARRSIALAGGQNVVRNSIVCFMSLADANPNLFRLLLGEGAGSTPTFRRAIAKEIQRFTDDLASDLVLAAEATNRPIYNVDLAAEAMVTVAFNQGAAAIDLSADERREVQNRIIGQVLMIMRGAHAGPIDLNMIEGNEE